MLVLPQLGSSTVARLSYMSIMALEPSSQMRLLLITLCTKTKQKIEPASILVGLIAVYSILLTLASHAVSID